MVGKKINIKTDDKHLDIEFFPDANLSEKDINDVEQIIKNFHMQIERIEDYDEKGDMIIKKEIWKGVATDITKFPTKKFSEVKNIPFIDICDIIKAQNAHEGHLISYSAVDFYAYKYHCINNKYPFVYRFEEYNLDKFITDLFKHTSVPYYSYNKTVYQNTTTLKITSIFIGFEKDLLLYIDSSSAGIIYYSSEQEHNKSSFFHTLMSLLKSYRKPLISKNKINIVYRTSHGFDKKGFNVNKININIEENYNDDFLDMSNKIITGLNDKNKTNLVILSGEPGTGKTSFIRYLTTKVKKNIIFISPDMVDSITDPAFIPFLMSNNDSVLIIEDAEPALETRSTGGRSSAVSNVLNLTDGLLSDCLKLSIVATFNTDKKTLDEALLRKGRLLMNYKFNRLNVEKSKNLLKKLGHKEVEVTEPMTLSDIYFYGTDNNAANAKNSRIGFK